MSNKELIKNHTIFHAYFCHLIEIEQADSAEELCEISWELEEEIKRRRISDSQIKGYIKSTSFGPQDELLIYKYIYNSKSSISTVSSGA